MGKGKGSGLNDKQRKFAEEYLVDLNATQAAIRAGYSAKTAGSQGERLLKNVEIQSYLQKRMKDRGKRLEITQDRVLLEVARVAFRDVREFYDEEGNLLPPKMLSDDAAACLDGLDVYEERDGEGAIIGYTKKIRFADKMQALNLLMRHMGLDKVSVELTGKNGGPVEVKTKVVVVPAKVPAKVETKPLAKAAE